MDEATRKFWEGMRASLIKEAHDLGELRGAKLQLAADIKRILDASLTPPKEPVTKSI